MTRVVDRGDVAELATDGWLSFQANCRKCGSGLDVEGRSRGRDDMDGCHEVLCAVLCRGCKRRFVVLVQMVPAP